MDTEVLSNIFWIAWHISWVISIAAMIITIRRRRAAADRSAATVTAERRTDLRRASSLS